MGGHEHKNDNITLAEGHKKFGGFSVEVSELCFFEGPTSFFLCHDEVGIPL